MAPSSATPLGIWIDTTDPLPQQAMVIIRGLPDNVRFSEGKLFGPGVWVVPLNVLHRVELLTPAESSRADLSFSLVTLEGTALAETKVTLLISPNSNRGNQVQTSAPTMRQLSEAERSAALKLVEKGDDNLKSGHITIAREFYKRAANIGLAEAALALGGTYDGGELQRMQNVVGVEADSAQAKKWYEKARDLGSQDAAARLRRLQ